MDAPKPTPMEKKYYSIEKDSQKYKLSLSISSNSLELQLETIGLFPNKIFVANLTKNDLEKISKLFKMNDSIEECLLNFVQFFDEEKYSFEEGEEKAIFTISPNTLNIKDFQIKLRLKEMNQDEKYDLVSIEIKNIIEENKQNKKKIYDLEKKCEDLSKTNELLAKKNEDSFLKNPTVVNDHMKEWYETQANRFSDIYCESFGYSISDDNMTKRWDEQYYKDYRLSWFWFTFSPPLPFFWRIGYLR